jgi:hypothetical protein
LAGFGLLYPVFSQGTVISHAVTLLTIAAGDGVKF